MSTREPIGGDDAEQAHAPQPVLPLEDAVRILNSAQRAARAQERTAREARHLQRLTALSQRRRAPREVMTVADSREGHDGPADPS